VYKVFLFAKEFWNYMYLTYIPEIAKINFNLPCKLIGVCYCVRRLAVQKLGFALTSAFDAIESPGCTLIMALSAIRLQFRSQVSCNAFKIARPGLLFLAAISFELPIRFLLRPWTLKALLGQSLIKFYHFARVRCISVFLSDTKRERILRLIFFRQKSWI